MLDGRNGEIVRRKERQKTKDVGRKGSYAINPERSRGLAEESTQLLGATLRL